MYTNRSDTFGEAASVFFREQLSREPLETKSLLEPCDDNEPLPIPFEISMDESGEFDDDSTDFDDNSADETTTARSTSSEHDDSTEVDDEEVDEDFDVSEYSFVVEFEASPSPIPATTFAGSGPIYEFE